MTTTGVTRRVRITNPEGLHLRAASLLRQSARCFPCAIHIRCGDRHADAKSVWELIGLVAEPGCELVLEAEGSQSEEALGQIADLVARQFQVSVLEDRHESQ